MNLHQKNSREKIMTTAHHDFEKVLNVRAFFKLNNHALGEDLVQDTFIKTWKYLVRGGKIEVMKSFLYHVLNNLIIDEYRKQKTISLDMILEKGYEPLAPDNTKSLMDILDGKAALLLIQRLPDTYKKVMRMRHVQDLSISEIALITGLSKNAITVQLHRGLEKLKLLYNHVG
ncbi:MAG: RNA polymerase sigma factor [Candidatus Paceibacterota bacterium]|jgi:RNA polymerase sigma-70 factor (ECF subfamily)